MLRHLNRNRVDDQVRQIVATLIADPNAKVLVVANKRENADEIVRRVRRVLGDKPTIDTKVVGTNPPTLPLPPAKFNPAARRPSLKKLEWALRAEVEKALGRRVTNKEWRAFVREENEKATRRIQEFINAQDRNRQAAEGSAVSNGANTAGSAGPAETAENAETSADGGAVRTEAHAADCVECSN